jgi:hypothetical protein
VSSRATVSGGRVIFVVVNAARMLGGALPLIGEWKVSSM